MKAGYSLIWSEGSLLTQQHFQYWELMLRREQGQHLDLWNPFSYGIKVLDVDTVALTRGTCIIHRLVARHPSGEWFYYDHEIMPPLSCELNARRECSVSLLVPNNAYCDNFPGYEVSALNPGYAIEHRNFDDMHHPEKSHELGIKRRHMLITTDHQETPAMLSLVLMCLTYKGGKHYGIHEHHIPPSLISGASPAIMMHSATVLQRITERSYHLNAWLAVKKDPIALQEALILSQATHFLQDKIAHMHPKALYDRCASLLVSLSVLRGESWVPDIYEHENLMTLFQTQMITLKRLLNDTLQTTGYVPALIRVASHEYEIKDIPDLSIKEHDWYLGVGYQEADVTWVQRFTKQAKIAAHSQFDSVLSAALPGVNLVHTQRTPAHMVIKSGHEYFKIIKQGDFWKAITQERSFKIHMPQSFHEALLTLDMVDIHDEIL